MNKLAIFDLDGTLLDTIADLATAANHALAVHGYPTHAVNDYRFFVGSGLNMLFFRALPAEARSEEIILKIRQEFIAYYNLHSEVQTAPYPGIQQMLRDLSDQGVALAVASNKYHEATVALVKKYFPTINFTAIFGQREGIPVKPDPRIVEDILDVASLAKESAFYIGDSDVDMKTAIHAGVRGIGVSWGFRPKAALAEYNPYALVDSPDEVVKVILCN